MRSSSRYAAAIPDVLVIEPKVFGDERGFFYESYNEKAFHEATELDVRFVQDNHSKSARNVLRGLHYQVQQPQGKLVRVVQGEVFDLAVDIRKDSKTYGQWVGEILSAGNKKQLWIPPGRTRLRRAVGNGRISLQELTTMRRPMSAALPGMTRIWPLLGRMTECPRFQPRMQQELPFGGLPANAGSLIFVILACAGMTCRI